MSRSCRRAARARSSSPDLTAGRNGGGGPADPDGILYVNANEMPAVLNMIDSSGATSLGQQVYLQNCTGCHGAERKGNAAGNIPSLVDIGKRLSRGQIMEVITKGPCRDALWWASCPRPSAGPLWRT